MVDLEKAKENFLKYVSIYRNKDETINRKIGHSLRVMEISKNLACDLKLSKEEIDLAALIGLLHDIGRFEQVSSYKTVNDNISIDHGDYGVIVLKKNNYIKQYIEDNEEIEIIFKAIKNHNKYKIEDNLKPKEELFCKIVKDADKLDILYLAVEQYWKEEECKIENEIATPEIVEQCKMQRLIKIPKNYGENLVDKLIVLIAFTFDINFKYTFQELKEKDYINKILARFSFKDNNTKVQVEEIRRLANEYIIKKINTI